MILGPDKIRRSGCPEEVILCLCSDLEDGGSQVAGMDKARGRRMVGNKPGARPCAHGGYVKESDLPRGNVKPLKSLHLRVGEGRDKQTFQVYNRSHCPLYREWVGRHERQFE